MGRNDDIPRRRSGPVDDRAVAALALRQHGIVSLGQLRALGLNPRGVQHRVSAGRLHRLHRGVYAVGHRAVGADARRMAAVLACGPGAVLSHCSAAAAWGLRPALAGRLEVTTTARGRSGPAGVDLHRVRRLHPDDVDVVRAIRITSVSRTLVDLSAVIRADALERALHEADVLGLLDVHALQAALHRAPTRRGTGTLRALLGESSAGTTRGALEERFLSLCRHSALPSPRLNRHLDTGVGLVEVDAFWPAAGLVVELDGAAVHQTRRAFHRDRRRDAALAAEGYVVVRLTWDRVTRQPDVVIDELRRILALRAAGGRE